MTCDGRVPLGDEVPVGPRGKSPRGRFLALTLSYLCPAMAARRVLGPTDDERPTSGVAAQEAPPTLDVLTANGQAPAASDQVSELPTSVELRRTHVVRPAEQGRTDGAKCSGGQVTALNTVSHSRGVLSLHLLPRSWRSRATSAAE